VRISEIAGVMDEAAPPRLAASWDRIGLQVGRADADARRVLVGLGPSDELLREAAERGVQLLVCHHPLIFHPLQGLTDSTPAERMAAELVRAAIAFFAAHTNLDAAPGGTNDALAEVMGLADVRPLAPAELKLAKVAVFVPSSHVEAVSAAICNAGAGQIGAYRDCTFRLEGTGTFTPGEGSRPFIGKQGALERVQETRLESIVPRECVAAVIDAMRRAHPYEEPAFDVYPLENTLRTGGLGRCGMLPRPMPLAEFAGEAARRLNSPATRFAGDAKRMVAKAAVSAGAGIDLADAARAEGCDVLLTADVKYHQFLDARGRGLAVIDAGHAETELPGVRALWSMLRARLPGVEVLLSEAPAAVVQRAPA